MHPTPPRAPRRLPPPPPPPTPPPSTKAAPPPIDSKDSHIFGEFNFWGGGDCTHFFQAVVKLFQRDDLFLRMSVKNLYSLNVNSTHYASANNVLAGH